MGVKVLKHYMWIYFSLKVFMEELIVFNIFLDVSYSSNLILVCTNLYILKWLTFIKYIIDTFMMFSFILIIFAYIE